MTTKTKARPVNRVAAALNGKDRHGAEGVVEVPRIELRNIRLRLIGDSELICHAWGEKAKREMLDKHMGKAKQKKAVKVPAHDFANSLYWMTEKPAFPDDPDKAMQAVLRAVGKATFGFPAIAFKAAAVSGCRQAEGIPMTLARNAFHINAELLEIKGVPRMREDMTRVGQNKPDIRYRGAFSTWEVIVPITLNVRALSVEQVTNLFNLGGFGVGVGEWRPEKSGPYGRFHVA